MSDGAHSLTVGYAQGYSEEVWRACTRKGTDLIYLLLALIPPVIVAAWFYKNDKNPEPMLHTVKAILSGALVCLPVLLITGLLLAPMLAGVFQNNSLVSSFIFAFFLAAIPEEFFKFVFLRRHIKSEEADEPYDFIFYGAMISVGFAAVENVLYVYQYGLKVGIARAFTAVPMHAICGAMLGYGLLKRGKQTLKEGYYTWDTMRGALTLPIIVHGLYNWPVLAFDHSNASNFLKILSLIFWIGVLFYLVIKFKRILAETKTMAATQSPRVSTKS